MKTRICILEDDAATRRILVDVIKSAPALEIVHDYGSSEDALAELPGDKPDVVLMDINLPNVNGVECVRRLKPHMPATQFLMLTVYEDPDHIFAALAAGATGYLLKGTRRAELLAAIEQILAGGSPMSSLSWISSRRATSTRKSPTPSTSAGRRSPLTSGGFTRSCRFILVRRPLRNT